MNELNEPKVTLPPAPEGMEWEYRGMGWYPERSTTYCHTTLCAGLIVTHNHTPSGITDYHYWEAIPDTLAESRDQFDRACDEHLARRIDHTEGGKYRMLGEMEVISEGDEVSAYPDSSRPLWRNVERPIIGQTLWAANVGHYRRPVTPESTVESRKTAFEKLAGISADARWVFTGENWYQEILSPEGIEALKRENVELLIEKVQRDVQIPLLVADRNYWKNKCEFLEAANRGFQEQATDALDKLTKIQQIIGQP